MPPEDNDKPREVNEAPRESGGDSGAADLARSGQEKPKEQADKEEQQNELRKKGGTPSSFNLPRIDVDLDDHGKLTITIADKSLSLDLGDKEPPKLDPGFTPKSAGAERPQDLDKGFVPGGTGAERPEDMDPGFTPRANSDFARITGAPEKPYENPDFARTTGRPDVSDLDSGFTPGDKISFHPDVLDPGFTPRDAGISEPRDLGRGWDNMWPRDVVDTAVAIRSAAEGGGGDAQAILQGLEGKNAGEIQQIKDAYQDHYGFPLKYDLAAAFSGPDLERALNALDPADTQVADSGRTAGDANVRVGDGNDRGTDKPPEVKVAITAEQAAKEFEHRADQGLAEAHKHLKFTDDGLTPRVVAYQDNFKVTADKGLMDLARDQLGPHATKEQIDLYATEIRRVNHLHGKSSELTVHAGDTIKMPGQASDGGVYSLKEGSTHTKWIDNSSKDVNSNGFSSAYYRNNGADVMTTWHKSDISQTHELTEKGKRQVDVRGDGVTAEKVPVVRTSDDGSHYDDWRTTRETAHKNGESIVKEYGLDEKITRETHEAADGRKLSYNYDKGEWDKKLVIEEPGGYRTVLEKNAESNAYSGTRMDKHGHVVERAAMVGDNMVYADIKTGKSRAETWEPPGDKQAFSMRPLGAYDANTGTTTRDFGSVDVVSSFAKGRVDLLVEDTKIGATARGDFSVLNDKTGDATVVHADGTGVHLRPDGTIDRWGPETKDNANGEKLSAGEAAYLKKHPEIDEREFAEIHRRFEGNAEKLDKFYNELEKLDSAHNLTPKEKAAIRDDVLHHVANPAEIYQGVTQSCNIAVIQRDMAMTSPDLYVKTIVTAVSEGVVRTADGQTLKVDVNNLKLADASGRDLATRVYQTAALHAEFWPARDFVNTPDGIGRLQPTDQSPPGTKTEVFDGLLLSELAEIRYKLTGEEKAVGLVTTVEELNTALKMNGGPPMTVVVDSGSPPFGSKPVDHAPNHVVTIVGFEAGPPQKYLVQNQWGLDSDHSTKATAIPAADLLANMMLHNQPGQPPSGADPAGFIFTKGDHSNVYDIYTNKVDYNGRLTGDHRTGNRAHQMKVAATPEGKAAGPSKSRYDSRK